MLGVSTMSSIFSKKIRSRIIYIFSSTILFFLLLYISQIYVFRYWVKPDIWFIFKSNSLLTEYEKRLNNHLLPKEMVIYSYKNDTRNIQFLDYYCKFDKEIYQIRPYFDFDMKNYEDYNDIRNYIYDYYVKLFNKYEFEESDAKISSSFFGHSEQTFFSLSYTLKSDLEYNWLWITNSKVFYSEKDWKPKVFLNNLLIEEPGKDSINLDLYYIELVSIAPKTETCFNLAYEFQYP